MLSPDEQTACQALHTARDSLAALQATPDATTALQAVEDALRAVYARAGRRDADNATQAAFLARAAAGLEATPPGVAPVAHVAEARDGSVVVTIPPDEVPE